MTDKDTSSQLSTSTSTRITVDYSVPLWGVLTVIGAGLLTLVAMYFTGMQTQRSVEELQILVKSGNTSVAVLSGEVALIKFRVDGHEAVLKEIQTEQRTIQRK
jgi:hypothetical protein